MQTQPHSVCHMTRRMACMRRTLMHGSRCAAVSSGAVGCKPHGAYRRVSVGAGQLGGNATSRTFRRHVCGQRGLQLEGTGKLGG